MWTSYVNVPFLLPLCFSLPGNEAQNFSQIFGFFLAGMDDVIVDSLTLNWLKPGSVRDYLLIPDKWLKMLLQTCSACTELWCFNQFLLLNFEILVVIQLKVR